MNASKRRIKALEKKIKEREGGLFTVYYKDGTSRKVEPGEALLLSLNETEKIDCFVEEPGGKDNGRISDFVNAFLSRH